MKEYKIYIYFFRIILRMLFSIFFIRYEIEGEENLDIINKTGRGALLASNHISNLDPVLYMLIQKVPVSFFAKKVLFSVPVLGWCIRKAAHVSINREGADSGAMRQAIAQIKEGMVLGIFPEGTRSADGELRPAKAGAGMIAYKSKAIVVPAAISGTREILPKNKFVPRISRVRIKIGQPLIFDDIYGLEHLKPEDEREAYKIITSKTMEEIGKLYESIR